MSSSFCSWSSWTKWERWVNLRFYIFASGVNQRNERGKWVQNFLVFPLGFGSFPRVFSRALWRNLVRVECVYMIKPMVVFVLLGIDAALVDGCGIWEHLQSFSESKCLQGYSKTLWIRQKILRLRNYWFNCGFPIRGTTNQRIPNQWL